MEDYVRFLLLRSRHSTNNNTRFEDNRPVVRFGKLSRKHLLFSLSRICPPPPFFSGINSIGEIPQVDSSRLALVTTRKRKDGGGHKTGSAIFSRPAKYVESVACSLLQSLAVVTSAAADCPEYRTS